MFIDWILEVFQKNVIPHKEIHEITYSIHRMKERFLSNKVGRKFEGEEQSKMTAKLHP